MGWNLAHYLVDHPKRMMHAHQNRIIKTPLKLKTDLIKVKIGLAT
jgi:hypothetical protein